ncbi:hypothetical protein DFA_07795 [Cavenderia fasciculata]|uniref:Uncharacterized protein n=1 Tax=Cavenderia fasciculata TaxID=261658 RepID=F4Q3E8_CACFS|nr:uncharacterized protein DFA_07795 [Cavenderia fasciculata]EGG16817.1 hypothetical protein DFA_07795 [Cavenderia fasciculata]|eukprot:XP_004355291.1 hypothetical protein DFA_07795 [Cavenderia fasciculata]
MTSSFKMPNQLEWRHASVGFLTKSTHTSKNKKKKVEVKNLLLLFSGETTYIGGFSIPSNPILSSQYQSSSISNGLVFTTYCPTVTPMLTIIDLDNQTTETITFKGTTCDMYAFGQYDNSTQTFYMVGWTDKKASSLTFSTYSMITKEITNVEFEYNLKYIGHVQTIYLFESQLYACIIQFTYAEVLLLDFETKSYKSIFKLDIAFPGGQFIFDPRGYIVGMMVEDDQAQYGVYTIDLRTLTTTQHTIPVKDYQTLSNIEAVKQVSSRDDNHLAYASTFHSNYYYFWCCCCKIGNNNNNNTYLYLFGPNDWNIRFTNTVILPPISRNSSLFDDGSIPPFNSTKSAPGIVIEEAPSQH